VNPGEQRSQFHLQGKETHEEIHLARSRSPSTATNFSTPSSSTRRGRFCAFGQLAHANTGIVLETISDYSYVSGGSHGNDTDANTEGTGFWNPMTSSGIWTVQSHYTDFDVWDVDFYDHDLTGGASDNDTYGFDQSGAGIAFFIGHGICDDVTNTTCTSDANCAIHYANSYCPSFPLASGQAATCIVESPRNLVISSSTTNSHGNRVVYGPNPWSDSIALGEDSNSGSFGGVGTNGGTNIAIITNSCGMRFRYRSQDQNRFYAGVHEVMMNMPVGNVWTSTGAQFADTAQWSTRGTTLANIILTNVNAPASSAWLSPTMVNNSYTAVGPNIPNSTYAGANIVGAFDSSWTAVTTRLSNETWAQSTDETRDPTSASVGAYYYSCNFANCTSYGL
jgi:hypothetical protein